MKQGRKRFWKVCHKTGGELGWNIKVRNLFIRDKLDDKKRIIKFGPWHFNFSEWTCKCDAWAAATALKSQDRRRQRVPVLWSLTNWIDRRESSWPSKTTCATLESDRSSCSSTRLESTTTAWFSTWIHISGAPPAGRSTNLTRRLFTIICQAAMTLPLGPPHTSTLKPTHRPIPIAEPRVNRITSNPRCNITISCSFQISIPSPSAFKYWFLQFQISKTNLKSNLKFCAKVLTFYILIDKRM